MEWNIFQRIFPFFPFPPSTGGVFFAEVGLGHETCFGQWKLDRSHRVALSRGLQGHHMFLLASWEHPPSTMRKTCSMEPKPESWPGPQRKTRGEDRHLTQRLEQSCRCQSADPWARKKCLLMYTSEMSSWLFVVHQKQTNTNTKKAK